MARISQAIDWISRDGKRILKMADCLMAVVRKRVYTTIRRIRTFPNRKEWWYSERDHPRSRGSASRPWAEACAGSHCQFLFFFFFLFLSLSFLLSVFSFYVACLVDGSFFFLLKMYIHRENTHDTNMYVYMDKSNTSTGTLLRVYIHSPVWLLTNLGALSRHCLYQPVKVRRQLSWPDNWPSTSATRLHFLLAPSSSFTAAFNFFSFFLVLFVF